MKNLIWIFLLFGAVSFAQATQPVTVKVTYTFGDDQMQVAMDDAQSFNVEIPKEHHRKISIFKQPMIGPIVHFTVFYLAKVLSSYLVLQFASVNPYLYPIVATAGDILVFYAFLTDGTTLLLDSIDAIKPKLDKLQPQSKWAPRSNPKSFHSVL